MVERFLRRKTAIAIYFHFNQHDQMHFKKYIRKWDIQKNKISISLLQFSACKLWCRGPATLCQFAQFLHFIQLGESIFEKNA